VAEHREPVRIQQLRDAEKHEGPPEMDEVRPERFALEYADQQHFARVVVDGRDQRLLPFRRPYLHGSGVVLPDRPGLAALPAAEGLRPRACALDEQGEALHEVIAHGGTAAAEAEPPAHLVGDQREVDGPCRDEVKGERLAVGGPFPVAVAAGDSGGETVPVFQPFVAEFV